MHFERICARQIPPWMCHLLPRQIPLPHVGVSLARDRHRYEVQRDLTDLCTVKSSASLCTLHAPCREHVLYSPQNYANRSTDVKPPRSDRQATATNFISPGAMARVAIPAKPP